ncbi:hypothetical protein GLOTRDRAFT_110676 [Gloeophyllum trabeum ATCC 11539]|uniref:Tetraspannin-domain-containing protein n=1 Tax=Gloeophyllum trabeum (strain ATCC 11539 / FP-39264 / Madison 617) TaxID=670483 RepID=S7RSU5_GLOTA|nr:uncharacterized protein GLOTRDRAFT_110676 [Gloeophyllum trabeum ATCC 11539]EPQ56139.1 hypothetical protein GLOTRDRAFT_110676 [Gloeophyllum trabeum ATCC 11539]
MAHHFCCCLPIRFGAFLISFVQFALNALLAVAVWVVVAHNKSHHVLDTNEAYRDAIAQGVLFTLTGVVALAAFIGTIRKSVSWIAPYAYVISILLAAKTIVAILQVILFLREPDSKLLSECTQDKNQSEQTCHEALKWIKALSIILFVLPLVVESYALWIIYQYGEKLEDKEEEAAWSKSQAYSLNSGPYSQVGGRGSQDGLANEPYSYPYADQAHSFGNKAV